MYFVSICKAAGLPLTEHNRMEIVVSLLRSFSNSGIKFALVSGVPQQND
jgi:hypothetical protein